MLYSDNLIILFTVDMSLSLRVVQNLLLRLREFPVELTSRSSELTSILTVAARGGTLYNELDSLANSFDPGIYVSVDGSSDGSSSPWSWPVCELPAISTERRYGLKSWR
jgi:hypothetical protein